MHPLSEKIDRLATKLEEKGLKKEAAELDAVSNTLDTFVGVDPLDELVGDFAKDAGDFELDEKLAAEIQGEMDFLEESLREVAAADEMEREAKKKKKKWTKDIDLKKGRFTEYCKREGFEGPCQECADKALKSDDKSVRGMAGFYLATRGMRKKKKGKS